MMSLRTRPAAPRRSVPFAGLFPAVSVTPKTFFQTRGSAALARRAIPNFIFGALALEVKLQRELHQAWIACTLYAAEVATVRVISVRLEELHVVEHVEKFTPELHPE